MMPQRYNSAIQRVKGFLEMASALYDSSLSYQTRRAAEGVLQTDTRLGYYLRLSLLPRGKQGDCISLSFAADSFRELKLLKPVSGTRKYYLTHRGLRVLVAGRQLTERIILPALTAR